jgi:glycosyltransferase involved in cell wall biosynthesis
MTTQSVSGSNASQAPEVAHLNLLVSSLNLGGAERCALDLAMQTALAGGTATIFVLNEVAQAHSEPKHRHIRYVSLAKRPHASVLAGLTAELLAARNRRLFIFCVPTAPLAPLQEYGIELIPVIQNSFPSWHESPRTLAGQTAVPLVIACSDRVQVELTAAQLKKPVHTIRHQVAPALPDLSEVKDARQRLRTALRAKPETIVIGMVGQFKAQKGYLRAAQVFAKIRARTDARLVIAGDGNLAWGAGGECWADFQRYIQAGGLAEDIFCLGAVKSPGELFHGFDVFLNTSYYEGLSIALLEAQQAGCPIVSAPAGGAPEVMEEGTWVVENADDPNSFVEAILAAASKKERTLKDNRAAAQIIADLYGAIADHQAVAPSPRPLAFIVENLNVGGVQKSLLKLLQNSDVLREKAVLISLEANVPISLAPKFEQLSVPHLTSGTTGTAPARASRLLRLCRQCGTQQVIFWNVPPDLKCVIAKIAPPDLQLVDVSPGPATYHELETQRDFCQLIAWDMASYFRRIDLFVAKYTNGGPLLNGYPEPRAVSVIRNGITAAAHGEERKDDLPILVTMTRIVPCKRLEGLLDMMDYLGQRRPEARLLIVGSAEEPHRLYADMLADKVTRAGLANVEFVPACMEPEKILRLAQVFVMFSDDQGCPNASLEAMALGLPVVSNRSGGVTEQVIDGVTGFLADDTKSMAARVEQLLGSAELRRRLGEAARAHVAAHFSLRAMCRGYENSLIGLLEKARA